MDKLRDEWLTGLHSTVIGWIMEALEGGLGIGAWIGEAEWQPASGDLHLDGAVRKSRPLGCRVIRQTALSMPSFATIWIAFDTALADNDGCWNPSSPTRLTAQTSGWYLAGGSVSLQAPPTNLRHGIIVRKGGAQLIAQNENHVLAGKSSTVSVCAGMVRLEKGEYVEIGVMHDANASLTVPAASESNQANNSGWLLRLV